MKRLDSDNSFYYTFLICLCLVSIPVKNFAYIVPPIYLLLQMWAGNQRLTIRTAMLSGAVLTLSAVSLLWDASRGQEVNVPGMILALLTFLPLLILLCENFDKRIDDALFHKLLTLCGWYVIGQSLVGIVQFLVTANPDAVAGTFGLFDFLNDRITIAHVYFTFMMYGMILFLSCDLKRPLSLTAIGIGMGLVTTTMAHSAHQIIFFVLSLGLVSVLRFWRPKTIISSTVSVVLICVLVNQAYPETLDLAKKWYAKVAQDRFSPKRLATAGGATILSDGKNLLLGTGLGQYSSRAALITSNDYLTIELPGFLTGQSDYFRKYILPADHVYDETGEGSAMSKPYYSLLSIGVEFGLIQSLLLAGILFASLWRNLWPVAANRAEVGVITMRISVGLIFFLLCCTIENYAEFPQAIFVPLLLLVAASSRVNTVLALDPTAVVETQHFGAQLPSFSGVVHPS